MWRYAGAHLYVIGGAFIKRSRLATNVPFSRRTVDVFVHDLNVFFLWALDCFTQRFGVKLLRANPESSEATLTRRSFFFVRWMGIEVVDVESIALG